MKELSIVTYDSIFRYFKDLSLYGYKKYNDVYKLLALIAIEEIVTGYFSNFITEEDYKVLNNTLNCLYGSTCLIPYKQFKIQDNSVNVYNMSPIRISEDYLARISEDRLLRLVNT